MTEHSSERPQVEVIDVPPNSDVLLDWAMRLIGEVDHAEIMGASDGRRFEGWEHQKKIWLKSYELYRRNRNELRANAHPAVEQLARAMAHVHMGDDSAWSAYIGPVHDWLMRQPGSDGMVPDPKPSLETLVRHRFMAGPSASSIDRGLDECGWRDEAGLRCRHLRSSSVHSPG